MHILSQLSNALQVAPWQAIASPSANEPEGPCGLNGVAAKPCMDGRGRGDQWAEHAVHEVPCRSFNPPGPPRPVRPETASSAACGRPHGLLHSPSNVLDLVSGPPSQPVLMRDPKSPIFSPHCTALHILSSFRPSCSVPLFSSRIQPCRALKACPLFQSNINHKQQLIADLDIQLSNHNLIIDRTAGGVIPPTRRPSSVHQLRSSTLHSLSSLAAAPPPPLTLLNASPTPASLSCEARVQRSPNLNT